MDKFVKQTSIVAPLDKSNVDTDAIIPKQFLKSIKRQGFGPNLFDEWRYLDHGEPGMDNSARPENPDFLLNRDPYRKAQILLTRENFGCGSSREHAPWALLDFGFKVVIAISFAEIFYNNCFKNGLLAIQCDAAIVDELFNSVEKSNAYTLTVDLEKQVVTKPDGEVFGFDIDEFRKHCLLNGLDDIGLTLQHIDAIKAYERRHIKAAPWLF